MTAGTTGQGFNDFIAGFAGGAANVAAGYPLETTKVQMQTKQLTKAYKGYYEAVVNINKVGLVRGFFRGMSFPLVTQGLVSCVGFGVAGHTLERISDGKKCPSYLDIYLAGAVGGAFMAIVDCPAERIKTVMQSQIPRHVEKSRLKHSENFFRGPFHCISYIYQSKGVIGLYRGFSINAIRDSPGCAFYFMMFHVYYDLLKDSFIADHHGLVPSLIGGGLAGCTQWIATMPIDVTKSLIQADHSRKKYSGILDCVVKTYKGCGLRGFYTGLGIACFMAFPVGCAEFFVYSQGLRLLNSIN